MVFTANIFLGLFFTAKGFGADGDRFEFVSCVFGLGGRLGAILPCGFGGKLR